MSVTSRLAAAVLLFSLTSCDPGVHIAYEKQFDQAIDPACVEQALKTVSDQVTRGRYTSEGDRGFAKGIDVTQFNYPDPSASGDYGLEVARLPNGKTNYVHEWGKLGTDIPKEERAKILPLLYRANAAVARRCHLSFDDVMPEQGDG